MIINFYLTQLSMNYIINFFFTLLLSNYMKLNNNCNDQFRLDPRTGMDLDPKSPNNKFIESVRKSQFESKIKILIDSIKWKELHILTFRKHPRTCPNNMIDSEEFFLFTVVFLQPFLSLISYSVLFSLSFWRVIYYGFYANFSTHV